MGEGFLSCGIKILELSPQGNLSASVAVFCQQEKTCLIWFPFNDPLIPSSVLIVVFMCLCICCQNSHLRSSSLDKLSEEHYGHYKKRGLVTGAILFIDFLCIPLLLRSKALPISGQQEQV